MNVDSQKPFKSRAPDPASSTTKNDDKLPTPAEIQSIIAKDLTELSNEEREKAFEDVHGISSQTREDPFFINSCLNELEEHLNTLKPNTSYELAESASPEYVRNTDFRLMFIRADFYVAKAAAKRMIKFLDLKRKLFGEDKLGREITLDDFDEDSMDVVKSGYAQISPCKDRAGRPIVFFIQKHKKFKKPEDVVCIKKYVYRSLCAGAEIRHLFSVDTTLIIGDLFFWFQTRAGFYMYMLATKTPEAQKKGISCVYYYMDSGEDGVASLQSTNSEVRKSLPVYFASLHLCYNDEAVWNYTCENVKKLNASARARFRPHGGTSFMAVWFVLN
jgi:hypothetical protein